MTGITRYIFRQLLVGAALVSLAMACIVWLTQSLPLLQFVVVRGFALSAWLKLTLYHMPGFIVIVIPPTFFLVTLFVYNKLAADRELVVAQAAGISRFQLTHPALLAAAVGAMVCYLLTLYVAPRAEGAFRELQWTIRTDASRLVLREGAFDQVAPGLTVYVRGRGAGGELEGIMVHDARVPDEPVTLLAERGMLTGGDTDDAAPGVVLFNGTRQQLDRSGTAVTIFEFDSLPVDFGTADNGGSRAADYRERSVPELLSLGAAEGLSPPLVGRMRAEAHRRLAGPLNAFGFTVVALFFLLQGGSDSRNRTTRVTAAVAALIGLEAAWLGVINLVAHTPTAAPLMYMVGLLPTALGLYMIARPVRWAGTGHDTLPAAST